MTEKKKDPRPKWSSKKYKNYGEFNKAVLDWRERNNKGYKWNKKDVVWEVRNGKRVPVDRNTNTVLKPQQRGIPGFVQDHINPLVINFSNKPFGFDYENLRGSDVYDEERGKFMTVGELKKDEAMRAEGRRTDEYEDKYETGEVFDPKQKLKVNKKKNKEEKNNKNYPDDMDENTVTEGKGTKLIKQDDGSVVRVSVDEEIAGAKTLSVDGQAANANDDVGPRERLTARDRMRAANVERFGGGEAGEWHVSKVGERHEAWKEAKKSGNMDQFRKDYGENLGSYLRNERHKLKIDPKKKKKVA